MAEERRLTKRERRERARRERRREQAAERKRQRRNRILAIVGTIAGVAAIIALFVFTQEEPAPSGIELERAAYEQAIEDAGCETVDIPPPSSTQHLQQGGAPPAEQLYPVRPTDAGPHFGTTHPVGVFDDADERATTHNLEHGAVVVWYDPQRAEDEGVGALEQWAGQRNRAGFSISLAGGGHGGAGIIVSPYPQSFTSSDSAFAFRGWTVAMDCDSFDATVGDGFLASHFGTRGQAPEAGSFGQYPEGVLDFSQGGEPAPTGGPTDGPTDGATDGASPADEGTEETTPADEGS